MARRALRIALPLYVALCLSAVTGLCDQKGTPKAPGFARRPNYMKKGEGQPKNASGLPKAGPPIHNPASPAARLYTATPEQRDRALEKLPPQAQERMRRELEKFDSLPPDQQRLMIDRAERLGNLPPEKRHEVVLSFQDLQRLPPERKQAVGAALRRLQNATTEQRAQFLSGNPFHNRFSPEEQKIILDLSEIMQAPK